MRHSDVLRAAVVDVLVLTFCLPAASVVNVAGLDIVDGNPKLLLALLWQTMRYHTLKILSSAGDGFEMEEDDIVEWANEKVGALFF